MSRAAEGNPNDPDPDPIPDPGPDPDPDPIPDPDPDPKTSFDHFTSKPSFLPFLTFSLVI